MPQISVILVTVSSLIAVASFVINTFTVERSVTQTLATQQDFAIPERFAVDESYSIVKTSGVSTIGYYLQSKIGARFNSVINSVVSRPNTTDDVFGYFSEEHVVSVGNSSVRIKQISSSTETSAEGIKRLIYEKKEPVLLFMHVPVNKTSGDVFMTGDGQFFLPQEQSAAFTEPRFFTVYGYTDSHVRSGSHMDGIVMRGGFIVQSADVFGMGHTIPYYMGDITARKDGELCPNSDYPNTWTESDVLSCINSDYCNTSETYRISKPIEGIEFYRLSKALRLVDWKPTDDPRCQYLFIPYKVVEESTREAHKTLGISFTLTTEVEE